MSLLPPGRPIARDHIYGNPNVSEEEDSVFAFQAPPNRPHFVNHAGTEGQLGTDIVMATTPQPSLIVSNLQADASYSHESSAVWGTCTHDGSMKVQQGSLTVLGTTPFSTPGPARTISQAPPLRCPRGAFSALSMSHHVDKSSHEIMDVPLPFSTPGPVVSACPPNRCAANNRPATARLHSRHEEVLPVIRKGNTFHVPGSWTSEAERLDTPSFPIRDDGEYFF
ncbi:hypothetical protein B0F90DRAFT_1815270 [Multifurca ochricompacta]|uniref:Uncharacterized protein n=1 Tax=Multifurca ochricompacta TaxID=376703 RepID=A0AAD4M8D7_9AGAM|nr:hypothetical protein B0F90DRAFT_1815270 [Multifurca ochricompacta]